MAQTGAAPVLLVLAGPAVFAAELALCDRMVAANLGFSRVVTTTDPRPAGRRGGRRALPFFHARANSRCPDRRGEFLEWAWVHGERRYGTPASSVLGPLRRRASNLVMSVDVQGVDNFRRASAGNPLLRRAMTTVFILVDHERLLARMRKRGQDDEAEIARRMATAEAEIREAPKFGLRYREPHPRRGFRPALLTIVDRARRKAKSGFKPEGSLRG